MIKINNIDYTNYAVLPVKTQYARDKSLDQGILTLKNMSIEAPFEPLTDIVIDGESFIVGIDNVMQSCFGKNPKYTHTITFVEQTKLLEKYFVDTCTFTNKLLKNYSNDSGKSIPIEMNTGDAIKYWEEYEQQTGVHVDLNNVIVSKTTFGAVQLSNTVFDSPISVANNSYIIVFKNFANIFGIDYVSNASLGEPNTMRLALRVYDKNNKLIQHSMSERFSTVSFTFYPNNVYRIEVIALDGMPSGAAFTTKIYGGIYYIATTESGQIQEDITIEDVINKLLEITETRRIGQDKKFNLLNSDAIKFRQILAPEFSITNCTLREALQQVGGYIHAEPRLVGDTIQFDDLNERNYANLPKEYLVYNGKQDIEQFCSEIDSNVNNLVNIDDEQVGTIIEPFENGLKTTRTELTTVDVKDTTAFIETNNPIEKIVKVEFGFLNGNQTGYKDITKYIFEKSEYGALDSYGGAFPYSKAWALYYTQGTNNIYGLSFKPENPISQVFENFSIINILNREYNTSIDAGNNPIAKMQFRVTYIPIINSRVKQRKPYIGATSKKAILNYNATANKVDTDYYGENLKGAVARLGNIEKTYTYIIKNKTDIPKAGQLFNKNYYISVVMTEKLNNYYKVTIGLSKDFNNWNEYIEINSNQRFYEVSEKQSFNRYVIYEDYLLVGDNKQIESNNCDKALVETKFLNTLKGNLLNTLENQITAIEFKSYDSSSIIASVTMPAISFSLGNSVVYQISMNNNFGAGTVVQNFNSIALGVQSEAQYSDYYGKIETIELNGFNNPIQNDIINYETAIEIGTNIPYLNTDGDKYFSTGATNRIILKKDNREVINIAYQIHCVTNREDIVIGSALPKMLAIKNVEATTNNRTAFYILDREIGNIEKDILDLGNNPIQIAGITVDSVNKEITFANITANATGKSIVLVDNETKELIFAINKDVANGETITLPKMMFRHKIYGS